MIKKRNMCVRKLHELTPDNIYITPDGRRYCRPCMKARRKEERKVPDIVVPPLPPGMFNVQIPKEVWVPFLTFCYGWTKQEPIDILVSLIKKYLEEQNA